MSPAAVVFDLNGTLTDLTPLDEHFQRHLGEAPLRGVWFREMLLSAFVLTAIGSYEPFSSLGRTALEAVASRKGLSLGEESRDAILAAMRDLPSHPEVPRALQSLEDAGFRLAILTNSSPDTLEVQVRSAGIEKYFEALLSVDAIRRYKPVAEVYRHGAASLGVETREMWFVAAHDWDIAGAMSAGCRGAYIARSGPMNPVYRAADVVGADLAEVAEQIIHAAQPHV